MLIFRIKGFNIISSLKVIRNEFQKGLKRNTTALPHVQQDTYS